MSAAPHTSSPAVESGPDALDALRELVTRGEPIAVMLADHRMPGMNGVEFLERAMDVAPRAGEARARSTSRCMTRGVGS